MKRQLKLLYLYPYEMNTYGDWGNVQVLIRRAEARGIGLTVIEHRPGDKLPRTIDGLFMGGGQDSGQSLIMQDFHKIGDTLTEWVENDLAVLTICGGYQLFGKAFHLQDGRVLEGIGAFDAETFATDGRLIGNIKVKSGDFGEILGFENHSGRTVLGPTAQPLGRVLLGAGNNGKDKTEGCLYRRAIGTYMHGPLLPKNPAIADWLLAAMMGISSTELVQLDDQFVESARKYAGRRPR